MVRRRTGRGPKPARRAAGWRRRWLRRLIRAVALLVALPHALLLACRVVPPPITPLMFVRLAEGHGLSRDWVGLADIAPSLVYAVVAAEDNRFCSHRGVDWTELRAAVGDYWSADRVRGASTITMQTVKNVVLWHRQHVVRKAIEMYLAHYLELIWPKQRIIEVYLNVAEWGPGIYGAEAAARHWFGKPASALTPGEASLLAAALPSPLRWQPDRPTRYLSNRAGAIRRRIRQLGPLLDCVKRETERSSTRSPTFRAVRTSTAAGGRVANRDRPSSGRAAGGWPQ